jgi:hypothetical protein
LAKEDLLRPKRELGKKLALERIEQCVTCFKAYLDREMLQAELAESARKAQKSPRLYRSSMPPHVYQGRDPMPQEHAQMTLKTPSKTPRKPSLPRPTLTIERVAMSLGERVPIELSPTGFAYFPRHDKDDDDWERVSQHSMPITVQRQDAQDKPQEQGVEKKATPMRSLFMGLFEGK